MSEWQDTVPDEIDGLTQACPECHEVTPADEWQTPDADDPDFEEIAMMAMCDPDPEAREATVDEYVRCPCCGGLFDAYNLATSQL